MFNSDEIMHQVAHDSALAASEAIDRLTNPQVLEGVGNAMIALETLARQFDAPNKMLLMLLLNCAVSTWLGRDDDELFSLVRDRCSGSPEFTNRLRNMVLAP